MGRLLIFSALLPALAAQAEVRSNFDAAERIWTLSGARIQARFELNPAGYFRLLDLRDPLRRTEWRAAFPGISSPVSFAVDGKTWDGQTRFLLQSQNWRVLGGDAGRLTVVLADFARSGEVTVELEVYDASPVLRYGVRFRNLGTATVNVTAASPIPWALNDDGEQYQAMRVEQWLPLADPADFEVKVGRLASDGSALVTASGSHNRYCTWLALADSRNRGLAFGWEFDGRAEVSVAHEAELSRLRFTSRLTDLFHPVDPDAEFQVPRAFVALYRGDWDEAGFVTQRFVERALAKPMPSQVEFPFASWDSWGYGEAIDETTLRRNAEVAARMGIELFVVDLGWARMLGDWRADPVKFPSGLRALSDYVHGLGMKFGLHFAFGEAMAEAPLFDLRARRDWTSSVNYGYFGARSLCLAHEPVQRWVIEQAIRLIDDYNVDWILQDGENMVRECTKPTHTHHAANSNYAGAEGLSRILQEIQRERPQTVWENCENGGNLMTFQMVRNYVTSIVNDASGARGARQSAYGATYPFPARYVDRYMPEQAMNSYSTRSYLLGGPWIFMNRLADLNTEAFDYAALEVARFKQMRGTVRNAKILHLSEAPAQGRFDALGAWDAATDSGVAVVTRDQTIGEYYQFLVRDAVENRTYQVSFADEKSVQLMTGTQLRTQGVRVRLGEAFSSEVVYITPAAPVGPALSLAKQK